MIECIECGAQIKVTLTGGEFLIRAGSTPDLINFEKKKKVNLMDGKIDEDVMLEVKVECSKDPSHKIFGFVDSKIRTEIYKRLRNAALALERKYSSI